MEATYAIGSITLEHPLMNAAGTCKVKEVVERLARSATSAIMLGSITVEPRTGNTGTTYVSLTTSRSSSLNSLGLPNPGLAYLEEYLPEMVEIAHSAEKPLFVSVAGFSPAEYRVLLTTAFDKGADLVELNLGCPNIWESGSQHRIPSFSPVGVAEIMHEIQRAGRLIGPKPVLVKLSPFSDPTLLPIIVRTITLCPYITGFTSTNTFPNALAFDDEYHEPSLSAAHGLGGYGGAALKPIGLGQVYQLRKALSSLACDSYSIIGVGGIMNGTDIWEYIRAGAHAVQVATAYCNEEEAVFERLLSDFLTVQDTFPTPHPLPVPTFST